MAKIKNVSGLDLIVPAFGGRLVIAGAVVDVPDDATYGFTCQEPNWSPADAAAKKAHAAGVDAESTTPTPEPDEAPSEKEND